MQNIQLTLTPEQARVVQDALDVYTRITLGQFEKLTELMRSGVVSRAGTPDTPRALPTIENIEFCEALLKQVKSELGFPSNGSHGIGHAHVHLSGARAYEVHKVLARTLAEMTNPNPSFKGVNYDGLLVRYTQDPEPVAVPSPR